MKTILLPFVAGCAFLLGGCATNPQSRASHQPDFAQWPPAVQQTVLAGKIDIGFTREQVQVALGGPDYTYARTTADGTSEVWGYRDRGPRFSFGVGVGTFGRHSATSIGIGTSTGGHADEKVRVVFDRMGHVASVEETAGRR